MQPERWEPDHNIVAAVLSSPKSTRKMTDLSGPDRSWLVAGLTLAGMTAQTIAERMSCSLRLVRTIRAEDMTQVCYLAQLREADLNEQMRKIGRVMERARADMRTAQQQAARLRLQFDQILDAHLTGTLAFFPRCSHPKVPYNVYRCNGREYCRTCRAEWDRANRKRGA